MGATIAVGSVGAMLGLAYWSNRKAEQRHARMRRTIIDTTERPTLRAPVTVTRKPAVMLEHPTAVELHANDGIEAARFWLAKVWQQKGHDKT